MIKGLIKRSVLSDLLNPLSLFAKTVILILNLKFIKFIKLFIINYYYYLLNLLKFIKFFIFLFSLIYTINI